MRAREPSMLRGHLVLGNIAKIKQQNHDGGQGIQHRDAGTDLIYREHDEIGAYEACIDRLDNKKLSAQIAIFKQDRRQYLKVLTEMARELGAQVPPRGDMKKMLTTGKIALADIMGDAAL
jgi:hypothetical protein